MWLMELFEVILIISGLSIVLTAIGFVTISVLAQASKKERSTVVVEERLPLEDLGRRPVRVDHDLKLDDKHVAS